MMRRAARLALACYPLAFRRRYGDELATMLDDDPPRLAGVADLARGAVRAHLRPPPGLGDAITPGERARLGLSGVLMCWVLCAAAGAGFAKATEDHPFIAAGHGHVLLGVLRLLIEVLAVVASAAVLIGASPLIVAALTQARLRVELRSAIGRAALSVVTVIGATAALVVVAAHAPSGGATVGDVAFVGWGVVTLTCAVIVVRAARTAVLAIDVGPTHLRVARACALVVTAAMAGITAATLAYAVGLGIHAPSLAGTANGPFALASTLVALGIQAGVMVLVTSLGLVCLRRASQPPVVG